METKEIPVKSILSLPEEITNDCKIHFAKNNGYDDPLELFLNDPGEIQSWNEWRGNKDDFNKTYIFTLVQFPNQKDKWLFVGVYKIIKRYQDYKQTEHGYDVELTDLCSNLIGRFVINYHL